jgi:hypothetical protein
MLERQADPIEGFGEPRHATLGKNNPSSRAAEAGESLPCTIFSPISVAKSPRIEPGGALIGSVGPMRARHASIADSPLTLATTTGPPVMKSTSSPQNGLSTCSA